MEPNDSAPRRVNLQCIKNLVTVVEVADLGRGQGDVIQDHFINRTGVVKPQSDVNDDCNVNMLDLRIMASEWLDCGWSDPNSCLLNNLD